MAWWLSLWIVPHSQNWTTNTNQQLADTFQGSVVPFSRESRKPKTSAAMAGIFTPGFQDNIVSGNTQTCSDTASDALINGTRRNGESRLGRIFSLRTPDGMLILFFQQGSSLLPQFYRPSQALPAMGGLYMPSTHLRRLVNTTKHMVMISFMPPRQLCRCLPGRIPPQARPTHRHPLQHNGDKQPPISAVMFVASL